MSAPSKQIIDLIERFERNIEAYQRQAYNETQVRREFIDPLFETLGWDVTNDRGYAEAYKDVIHEDAIKVGGDTKAPDYCFRIGGTRKFFVEAKKPSVSVKGDISPAYQLRRYAWSAKLPLSILTDFEEFAVYDCRFRPKPNDKPSAGRILYLTYRDYASRWEEIASIFSRDAVLKGSFDKYAVSGKGKRGTSEVDAEFLSEIEKWRDDLARNLALRNPDLTVRGLNFAVQRTIDRIIFLRMCEDRGVETYGQLQALLNGENTYARLRHLFDLADDRYNSGLFHFKPEKGRAEAPDKLTPALTIDDKVLKDIIRRLYYPESPYEFSVLSADILGNVYEQFLGKVIRLTAGHQARIEDKPEVKKAGGVYYTPAYIVDYIVKNTVGKLCEGKSPKQTAKLRILDPACGSGSFLIGAYTYLLDYHRDWYVENDPNKHTKEIYQGAGEQWFLTTQEKKRILLNNIYGVDIDSQAVEVTKLSLLLKVLEGENKETLNRQLKLLRERALPDLASNIKCGNSLIGPDFYDNQQMTLLNEEEHYRINAFDWNTEFPEIMKEGGFNAVIGNPPWGAEFLINEKKHLMAKFDKIHMRTPDSFNFFLGTGLNFLRNSGLISMIIPNNFFFQHEYAKSREYFVKDYWLQQAINLGDGVFNVTAPSCIIVVAKDNPKSGKSTSVVDMRNVERESLSETMKSITFEEIDSKDILSSPDNIIPMNKITTKLISSILNKYPTLLGNLCDEVAAGIGSGGDKIFRIENNVAEKLSIENDILKPVLVGREINAYYTPENSGYSIIYSTKTISAKTHPKALEYLKPFQKKLSQKRETKKGLIPWWSLHWPRYPDLFKPPKLILRQTADSLHASIDTKGYYCLNSIIIIRPKDLKNIIYFTGLLNSKLLRWLYNNLTQESDRVFAEVKPINLRKLPIRTINFSDLKDKVRHDRMVGLVEGMLELHKRLKDARTPDEKTRLQRQIDATDKQIDMLVYELYGLTEEEIGIVEGETM